MNREAERIRYSRATAVAVALPSPALFELAAMREKFQEIRDTLVVFSMQIAFRAVMFLRHLNY